MAITVLTLRGTGEPVNGAGNMLKYVTNLLNPVKYSIGADIAYPASIGPVNPQTNPQGISEQQSIDDSIPLIAAAVRDTPNLVGLLGYSLGASCVSRFLELKAQGQYSDCEIAWSGLVANPWRARGEGLNPEATYGFGISGQHSAWPTNIPTFTVANPADGITSCPAVSPLRDLAPGVDALTFAELNWTPAYAASLLTQHGEPYTPAEYVQAAALLRGYLIDGQHMEAYVQQGYVNRLADALNNF
jgi:hypothetical protein